MTTAVVKIITVMVMMKIIKIAIIMVAVIINSTDTKGSMDGKLHTQLPCSYHLFKQNNISW